MFAGFCVYAYRKFVRYEEAPPEQPSARRRHRDPGRPASRTAYGHNTTRLTTP